MSLSFFDQPDRPASDDVVAEWLDPHVPMVFVGGHQYLVKSQQATAEAVIAEAEVKPGFKVIDIGCGSGIPSLALAEAVGPSGHVTATDPSPVFVSAVTENAAQLGLTNLTAVEASAAGLPFAADSFDAATCHMAVMFFPDVNAGLARIRRVLHPGGRAAFVAWGPVADNSMFGSFWSAAGPYLPPDPPNPAALVDLPQPMRFAEAGSLTRVLTTAGFANVREESRLVDIVWPGPAESNLAFWLELTGIEKKVAVEVFASLRTDVLESFRRFQYDDALHFSARIVVASGRA